ncbi:odorant receptor 82a-like [Megachile rotundata]|uniref:odorant receptor 82a-like n=1 Tax=Megachile rotundata TaxID=143995 RepID=UPI003FD254B8
MMNDQETQVKDVLILNERVFWICDAWPLNNSYKKFVIFMFYLSVYIVIMDMDLYDVMGDLELMVENILDNTLGTTTYLMLFLFRFSKMIKHVIATMKRELAEDDFRNNEEKQLYLTYNIISDNFGRYAVRTTAVIVVMWYSTPMLKLLKGTGNGTGMYRLPFRIHSFFDYEDNFKYYMLLYAYELPIMCIGIFHITSISLLLSLVLHVCGKFSILSYRIQNIVEDSENGYQSKVKELVERHVELIMTANALNSALQLILALELLQTSVRMAVLMYTILLLPSDDLVDIFTYGLYVMIVTLMLYLYSYIGEQLQYESTKVNDAYYDANWLKLSTRDQKLLLYCMCNGRRTLSLTAGKFYSFSLFGFIKVSK